MLASLSDRTLGLVEMLNTETLKTKSQLEELCFNVLLVLCSAFEGSKCSEERLRELRVFSVEEAQG